MNRLSVILNLTSRVTIVVATLVTLNNSPALAQEFSSQPQAPSAAQDPLSQVPADVRAKMQPGVRYTVGAKVTQGWEQTLTKGNRNLGHFYWSPIVNYVQATPSRKTGNQAVAAEPQQQPREQFHYVKPRTAPLGCNPAARASAWKKPAPMQKVILRSSRSDVSAKIAFNKEDVSASLVARPTVAKSYRPYNSDSSTTGSLSSKDAYGQIIGR